MSRTAMTAISNVFGVHRITELEDGQYRTLRLVAKCMYSLRVAGVINSLVEILATLQNMQTR